MNPGRSHLRVPGRGALTILAAGFVLALTASPAAAAPSAWFASPSGNIGCYMTVSGVRCDVVQHSYVPPKKPATCAFAWGLSLQVTKAGKGSFRCVSDTVAGSKRILAYGRSITIGEFRCVSRTTGMTCVDTRTGHGFELSKVAYRLF